MKRINDLIKSTGITYEELLVCFQTCINTYNGSHGEVKQVLKFQEYKDINGIKVITGYTNDDVLCIGFRGTNGNAEWMNNFDFAKTDIPFDNIDHRVNVHLGFIDHYRIIRTWLLDYIGRSGCKKVIFTGHSLGATTSTYACLDIVRNFPYIDIKNVIIGSPRPGNDAFKTLFDSLIKKSISFRYRNDIVPRVPMESLDYRHVKNYVWLDKPSLKDKLLHPIRYVKGFAEDHEPKRYLRCLEENFEKI